jgi:hypothetical protein
MPDLTKPAARSPQIVCAAALAFRMGMPVTLPRNVLFHS